MNRRQNVRCTNPKCDASGIVRVVTLPIIGPGVVAAPGAMLCLSCGFHLENITDPPTITDPAPTKQKAAAAQAAKKAPAKKAPRRRKR